MRGNPESPHAVDPTDRRPIPPRLGAEQWRALHSPVRMHLIAAIEPYLPMSVADMARLLGRPQTTLYPHVAILADARFLEESAPRRGKRRFEKVYGRGPALDWIPLDPTSGEGLREFAGAVGRAMTDAARHASQSIRSYARRPIPTGVESELKAYFVAARLDAARLRAVNEHIAAILGILRSAPADGGAPLQRFVIVSTPESPARATRLKSDRKP